MLKKSESTLNFFKSHGNICLAWQDVIPLQPNYAWKEFNVKISAWTSCNISYRRLLPSINCFVSSNSRKLKYKITQFFSFYNVCAQRLILCSYLVQQNLVKKSAKLSFYQWRQTFSYCSTLILLINILTHFTCCKYGINSNN